MNCPSDGRCKKSYRTPLHPFRCLCKERPCEVHSCGLQWAGLTNPKLRLADWRDRFIPPLHLSQPHAHTWNRKVSYIYLIHRYGPNLMQKLKYYMNEESTAKSRTKSWWPIQISTKLFHCANGISPVQLLFSNIARAKIPHLLKGQTLMNNDKTLRRRKWKSKIKLESIRTREAVQRIQKCT